MEYRIFSSTSTCFLEEIVNKRFKEDWKLYGNVVVIADSNGNVNRCYQAMTRLNVSETSMPM